MIRICKICGKEFEGRYNSFLCSTECKRENARIKARKYRECNPEKIKAAQRKWWNENRAINITQSDNLDITFTPKKSSPKKKKPEPKYNSSKWAKVYTKADRLTKISMLSWQLSKNEIEHLSYGELSIIWDTEKYNNLLKKVLDLKQQEERKKCQI